MRITWGATILALAVVAGVSRTATTIEAAPPAAGAGAQAAANVTPEQLEGYMKSISSTQTTLRAKLKENQLADAAKDAQQLATTFGDVEKFFAQRSKTDAVSWAQLGKTGATAVAGALTAGDAAKANTELGNMAASCKQCHAAYREGGPQAGGYTIKAGSI